MLQGIEERHQCRVAVPSGTGGMRQVWHVVRASFKGLRLHGQIDLSVSVSRLEGDMTQPRADCVE